MKIKKTASQLGLVVGVGLFGLGLSQVANSQSTSNQLDFESLKAKCLELSSNQQLKPFKAIVTCRDVSYVWRQAEGKETQPLQNEREIGSSIRMKGFETPYIGENIAIEPSQAQCIFMDKWKVTVPSVDVELSCDELNAIEDLTQFCLEQIDQRVQEDPSLVIEEATGERFNSCNHARLTNVR